MKLTAYKNYDSQEDTKLQSEVFSWVNSHPMFASNRSFVTYGILEFLANREGKTIYDNMLNKEVDMNDG